MDNARRWDMVHSEHEGEDIMVVTLDGLWVLHSDYDALRTELATTEHTLGLYVQAASDLTETAERLRKELEETKALLTSAQETISKVIDNKDKFVEQLIKAEAQRDEAVKALEEAVDAVRFYGGQCDDWYKEKYGYQETIKDLELALARVKEKQP